MQPQHLAYVENRLSRHLVKTYGTAGLHPLPLVRRPTYGVCGGWSPPLRRIRWICRAEQATFATLAEVF